MAERNFNWGDAYMQSLQDPMRATPGLAPEGVMGGIDLVNSGRNVAGGQGDFLDYLTLALAPTAFAGYGVSKLPAAARVADTALARTILDRSLRNPRLSIGMTPSGIEGAARSGAVKNAVELQEEGTDLLRAPGYLDERKRIEESVLGIPQDAPGSARPYYGAITSGIPLPYSAAQRAPGVTGEILRTLDPRFNRSMASYAYALNNNFSDVAPQGVAMTRPGAQGSFTISDSFLEPDRVFQIGNPADRAEAVETIIGMARQNANPKNLAGNVLSPGPRTLPYIEAQISPETNPFGLIDRFNVPITAHRGTPWGFTPESANAKAAALKEFLNSQGAGNIKTGTTQAIEPAYVNEARRAALKLRNSKPGRVVRDAAYQVSQIPANIKRRNLVRNPNRNFMGGVDWTDGDQIL